MGMKIFIVIASILAGALLLATVGADRVLIYQAQNYENNRPTLIHRDYGLRQRSSELGIDTSKLNLKLVNKVEGVNTTGAEGAFTPPNTIEVNRALSPSAQRLILAHEYLHYLWENEHTPALEDTNYRLYQGDTWLRETLSSYTNCDKSCLANETHSYICTAEDPSWLTPETNRYCDSKIPNRSILFQ